MARQISVTVRTELKNILTKKLNRQSEALRIEHADDIKRIEADARTAAMEAFGISELGARADIILAEQKRLEAELTELHKEMDEVANVSGRSYYGRASDGLSYAVQEKMGPKVEHFNRELLAATEFGKKLNSIEEAIDGLSMKILQAVLPEELKAITDEISNTFGV